MYLILINIFLDELQKLVESGFGKMVTKEQMNRVLPHNQSYSIFWKPHISFVDEDIFAQCHDELNVESYILYFNKAVDDTIIKIIHQYHDHKDILAHSQLTLNNTCKHYQFII